MKETLVFAKAWANEELAKQALQFIDEHEKPLRRILKVFSRNANHYDELWSDIVMYRMARFIELWEEDKSPLDVYIFSTVYLYCRKDASINKTLRQKGSCLGREMKDIPFDAEKLEFIIEEYKGSYLSEYDVYLLRMKYVFNHTTREIASNSKNLFSHAKYAKDTKRAEDKLRELLEKLED